MRKWNYFLICGLLNTIACSRSPESYVERGNQLLDAGKYEDAALNYRKAVLKDARFGEAYYQLGLTELKRKNRREAFVNLSTASGLLPDRTDVAVALADVLLDAYLTSSRRPAGLYDQLTKLSDRLLAKDPKSYDGLRLKGNLAWTDGKLEEAESLFRKANESRPMDPHVVLVWTQVLFQNGHATEGERQAMALIQAHKNFGLIYDVLYRYYLSHNRRADAENIIRSKVRNNPNEIDYALELASCLHGVGKREEMKATLQGLLANPQVFPNARLKIGDFHAALQEWPEAVRQYEDGAKADPKTRITYLKRIVDAWLAQGKGEQAIGDVDEILKREPNDEAARAVNASLLVASGKPDKIEAGSKVFEDLVAKSPDNAVWRFNLGRALLAKGDPDAAQAQFKHSIAKRPDLISPRLILAELSARKHDYAQTVQYANEALTIQPGLPGARILRAVGLMGVHDYRDARSELVGLESQFPQDAEVQYQLAALDAAEKKFPAAQVRLQGLYQKGEPRALGGLVQMYSAEDRLDMALDLLTAELKKSPDSVFVRSLMADTALKDGKYDIAVDQYQRLVANDPQSEKLQMRLGTVYELNGDLAQAIAAFEKAKELAPRDAAAAAALADAFRLAGRKPEAIANFRRTLAIEPENAAAMNNLAFLLVEEGGNLEEAARLVEHALQKMPREPNFIDTLGLVYLRKHLGESAARVFGDLTRKYPGNPLFRYHYGLALFGNGQNARARAELEAALRRSPSKDVRNDIDTTLAMIR